MYGRLGPLLANAAFGSVAPALRRAKRNAVLYGLLALLALSAYAAGVVALGIYIAETTGALEAALIIAAAMVALAVLVLLITMILNRIDRRRHAARDRSRAMTASLALSLLPMVVRSKPLVATATVGGLAFLAFTLLNGDGGTEE